MAKWVTILLLVLVLVAYGFSQMRPVPPSDSETSRSVKVSTSPKQATASPMVANDDPTPNSNTGVVRTTKAPSFANLKPSSSSNGTKTDPFAPKANTPAVPQVVAGTIKASILSSSSTGAAQTKFPTSTESIYLTATPEGLSDQVDLVASYRSVLDEKAEFSAAVESSGPPRKRTFRLLAPAKGWQSGPYQVVMKVKGGDQVLGLERFEILKANQSVASTFPAPEYLDLVPDLKAENHQSSFTMADEEILLRVSAQELARGTQIRSVWSAVEVDRLTSGELIATSSQTAPGPGNDAVFNFKAPPGGFHTGSYKVDVYFEDSLAGSQTFFIQAPAATTGQK